MMLLMTTSSEQGLLRLLSDTDQNYTEYTDWEHDKQHHSAVSGPDQWLGSSNPAELWSLISAGCISVGLIQSKYCSRDIIFPSYQWPCIIVHSVCVGKPSVDEQLSFNQFYEHHGGEEVDKVETKEKSSDCEDCQGVVHCVDYYPVSLLCLCRPHLWIVHKIVTIYLYLHLYKNYLSSVKCMWKLSLITM